MARHLDLDKYRKLLEEERARALSEIEAIRGLDSSASESQELGELSDYDQHPADSATETFERERDLAIEDTAEVILRQTEAALKKIDEGTYGTCERCGKLISAARLEAIPYTPYCIEDAEWLSGR
jgi:RNA polymerase-binding transcription factor DksA